MLRNFRYIIPIALSVIILSSCTKSKFDINTDPNNPSTLPVNILLTNVESSLGSANELTSGISSFLEVYMHRIIVRESPNGYLSTPSEIGGVWDTYYQTTLTNANIIIDKATADANFKYVGIAKAIKAYAFSQLVDIFGDVPYTDANQLPLNIKNPKFDKGSDIYPKLLTLLDAAIADLNNPTTGNLKPGADDVIYNGDATKWIKFANTLKLKLYTQQSKTKNVSAETTALLASGNLISKSEESFNLPHSATNKNAAYSEYGAGQRTQYISPWFYEILKGYHSDILSGNPDPRIAYYFYNQIKSGQSDTNDGNANTEYRDGSFVSIIFDSDGPNSGFSQQKSLTTLGIYPAGGLYDNGAGVTISNASATGAAPFRMLTYADRLFLQAELINTNVVATGDARAVTLAAINESFKQVDDVVAKTGNTAPVLVGTAAANTYITKAMAEYDAATNPSKKLDIIITQKWIQSFGGNSVDPYSDYRRTGYPTIFDPSDPAIAPGGIVQPPIHGNPLKDPQLPVKVSLKKSFPLSIFWPQEELDVNANAPAQKNQSTFKVFWQ